MASKTGFDSGFIRRSFKDHLTGNPLDALKAVHNPKGPIRVSSGKSQKARQESQKQEQQIAFQQQKEDLRLATSEDEVAKRKAIAKGKTTGRSLLTATSPTGVQGLGG